MVRPQAITGLSWSEHFRGHSPGHHCPAAMARERNWHDMTTEERLENLEQRWLALKRLNHWLEGAVVLCAVLLTIGGLLLTRSLTKATPTTQAQGVGTASKTIRANAFILEDAEGRTRASLDMAVNGALLKLSDENGGVRALLTGDTSGGGLRCPMTLGTTASRWTSAKGYDFEPL